AIFQSRKFGFRCAGCLAIQRGALQLDRFCKALRHCGGNLGAMVRRDARPPPFDLDPLFWNASRPNAWHRYRKFAQSWSFLKHVTLQLTVCNKINSYRSRQLMEVSKKDYFS